MNIIYMILRMMSVLGEKTNAWKVTEIKITVSKIWTPAYSAVKRTARNVKTVIEKTATAFNGFYRSIKRCV